MSRSRSVISSNTTSCIWSFRTRAFKSSKKSRRPFCAQHPMASSCSKTWRKSSIRPSRNGSGLRRTVMTPSSGGHDAVLLQVYQQPTGNTVEIASGIKAKLREMKKQIPDGVKIADWYDQSDLITASEHSTRDAVLIGIVLAAIVLLAFLGDLKVTLIATLTVPAVLAATILLLYVLKMSFNIMTLGGMAAAVGLIIDDAIVMVEH